MGISFGHLLCSMHVVKGQAHLLPSGSSQFSGEDRYRTGNYQSNQCPEISLNKWHLKWGITDEELARVTMRGSISGESVGTHREAQSYKIREVKDKVVGDPDWNRQMIVIISNSTAAYSVSHFFLYSRYIFNPIMLVLCRMVPRVLFYFSFYIFYLCMILTLYFHDSNTLMNLKSKLLLRLFPWPLDQCI